MKLLLVGEAPGPRAKTAKPTAPLGREARSGKRLAHVAGLDWSVFADTTERVNILDEHPGGKWPLRLARERALSIDLHGRRALLLGKRVAASFDLPANRRTYMAWLEHREGHVAILPHPSGLNRWWNEPVNVRAAQGFLVRALGGDDE